MEQNSGCLPDSHGQEPGSMETKDEHLHVVIHDFDSPDINSKQAFERTTLTVISLSLESICARFHLVKR